MQQPKYAVAVERLDEMAIRQEARLWRKELDELETARKDGLLTESECDLIAGQVKARLEALQVRLAELEAVEARAMTERESSLRARERADWRERYGLPGAEVVRIGD